MNKGHIKRVFPGGNTSQGFFSYYDYILEQDEASRIFILKGGPGVGKSTFMEYIGNEMANRGFDVEFMQCSSDNDSLDGIVVPALKTALIDGTAPHILDPKNPGAVDEIINLGDFWNREGIKRNKAEIIQYGMEIKRLFERAYRYIKAAACFHEDSAAIYGWAMNPANINILADQLINDLFQSQEAASKEGKQRHLFASAITPGGLKNYLDTVLVTGRIYAVRGLQGTGTERLLEKIKLAAVERGFYTESFYCALHPQKIEHLVIPEADVSLTTVNSYHKADIAVSLKIDLNSFLDENIISKHAGILEFNRAQFDFLLQEAILTINMAKKAHDMMEKYYVENMNFEARNKCMEETLAKILEQA